MTPATAAIAAAAFIATIAPVIIIEIIHRKADRRRTGEHYPQVGFNPARIRTGMHMIRHARRHHRTTG